MRLLEVMAGAADGGAETAFADHCIALAEAGCVVEAVTRNNNPDRIARLRQAGLTVHTLPFGGGLDLFTPWAMRRIIRAFRPDIVQTWMSRAAQKTPAWRASDGIRRYAIVSRLGGYYKLRHFPHTDMFVTITPDIKRWLESQGVPASRIMHINNFAETESHAAPADRTDMDTPETATLLLALGRLHRAKALDVLIDAVSRLPGIYLWIAGEGPERAALEAQIAALNLNDRVRLLGWRNDRAALLQAADICVFPSRFEPFGTVFVQAWANRTPVIVSDADGPRQFVRDGEDGLVVPADNAAALTQAINRLLGDDALRQRLAAQGYERYQAEFKKEIMVEAYKRVYAALGGAENLASQAIYPL